jgi:hypothetical protein
MQPSRLTIGPLVKCSLMKEATMHRKLAAITVLAVLGVVGAGAAVAGQPANPGCFGTDRAAYANANGSLGHEVDGVGYYASLRAGDNGAINRTYKTGCGGDAS